MDLVRIDGSFPSFSDDDAYILYNEGFTGVSAVARDGSNKQLIFKVCTLRSLAQLYALVHRRRDIFPVSWPVTIWMTPQKMSDALSHAGACIWHVCICV